MNHLQSEISELDSQFISVFPVCAVTHPQSQTVGDFTNLSDTVLFSQPEVTNVKPKVAPEETEFSALMNLTSKVCRSELAAAQHSDPSLATCGAAVVDITQVSQARIAYFWEDGIKMYKWKPLLCSAKWQEEHQIVLAVDYRPHVLRLAHENVLSGHLGVTKTFHRIMQYYFWPGLKSDVSTFVCSCHICELVGKLNQTIPVAPLKRYLLFMNHSKD